MWERVSYILQLNKEIINLINLEIKKSWFHLYFICYLLLRSDVLAISMKQSRTSIRDWVKTLLTLTAVNILFTSFVTLSIKMYS